MRIAMRETIVPGGWGTAEGGFFSGYFKAGLKIPAFFVFYLLISRLQCCNILPHAKL